MVVGDPRDNLVPLPLVARICTVSREEFEDTYQDERFLLVRLGVFDDAVARGLQECPTDDGEHWFPRSEATGTGTIISPLNIPDLKALSDAALLAGFDANALRAILDHPHYALPLRKRPGAERTDAERIFVGRSHANDIVLMHPSVSKQHAWLEWDERSVFISDDGSTNFTRVSGRILETNETATVQVGEELQFGDVITRVVNPGTLWACLNQ